MNKVKMIIASAICFILGIILLLTPLNFIGMILFMIGVIMMMIVMITWSQQYGKKTLKETMKQAYVEGTSQVDSMNILKTRYAKGEITKEQFE
jgi:uncharacterized membrane protein